jgi:xanthine dehydrogenase YagS FAD-binding subunit
LNVHPFKVSTATDAPAAIAAHVRETDLTFIAGGTDLLGLMKDRAAVPKHLLDINRLSGMTGIEVARDGSLRIGALARMSDVAAHMEVRRRFPVLAEALLLSASGQIRNMASMGGNILQRTRCAYFRDGDGPSCNKRIPGSGCSALHGLNRGHAIFGWSEACVATQPSDLAVALAALDAKVEIDGRGGHRAVSFADFHRLPGDSPEKDTVIERGDLISAIRIPAMPEGQSSHYLKIRDRQSYEFALVSVAAAVSIEAGRISSARIALGGVAHKPWRLPATEGALPGNSLADSSALRRAVALSFSDARPLSQNAFKIELAQRAVVRALQTAGARV